MVDYGFNPQNCYNFLLAICRKYNYLNEFIDPEAILQNRCIATNFLLFDIFKSINKHWVISDPTSGVTFSISDQDVSIISRKLIDVDFDKIPFSNNSDKQIDLYNSKIYGCWPLKKKNSIHRREHACLQIFGETHSILIDPQAASGGWTTNYCKYPVDIEPIQPDAVFISHSHDDHWSISSILMAINQKNTPIYTPRVNTPNLLTPTNFVDDLNDLSLNVKISDWHTSVNVGDVCVDILPFYGEQPTSLIGLGDLRLRNFGNCFRVTTPHFSVFILVDSGSDYSGNMLSEISRSVEHKGPADGVISCCHTFPEVVNFGLPHYAFTVPFDEAKNIYDNQVSGHINSITFGPEGILDILDVAGTRNLIPYAHGFNGLHQDVDSGALNTIQKAAMDRGVVTNLINCNPGCVLEFDGKIFSVVS